MPPTQQSKRPAVASRGHILATDLDGTFIPLDNNAQNCSDLRILTSQFEAHGNSLIFVTGRHFESVTQAIQEFQLPQPDWIICDVGTSIFQRQDSGTFTPVTAYQDYQDQIITSLPLAALRERLQNISGLQLQEPEKQGRFKLSFYADASQLDELVDLIQQILDESDAPYSIIHSIDPFNGDGLIDLLPATVSKAHALEWWSETFELNPQDIVFAGDSGNDLTALTAGYRTILVGNADRSLAQRVHNLHRESGWNNRLYLAHGTATSGVLEGCRWFGLADPTDTRIERLGATPVTFNETYFRVWAPRQKTIAVEIHDQDTTSQFELTRDAQGYFAGTISNVRPGALYQYCLDHDVRRPDPASRYQPEGVHGVSQVINADQFPWTDQDWQGIKKESLIIYELHLGSFTEAGTFRATIKSIPELIELGITAIEIMPVAQSPGKWNWGYDGVDLFAVRNTYGTVEDFKAFVDACHAAGLAVILDVVSNHVGPEGNYLSEFGPYFSEKHHTAWGEAFNFDGPDSQHVRQFIIDNSFYWLEAFHLDGLRLDAVHCMYDDSQPTILDEIRQAASGYADSVNWPIHLIAETNVYNHDLLTQKGDRAAYDGIWCDCLMYSIYSYALPDVRLTHREYHGAQDLADTLQYGYVYSGAELMRVSESQRAIVHSGRDQQSHINSLIVALQTHDSVGNHPHGSRIHHLTSKQFQKAAAGLVILYPSIPLIFMGEEFAVDSPFPFFADFEDNALRKNVDQGRIENHHPEIESEILLPSSDEAFYQAKFHDTNRRDREMFDWYRELLLLRKQGIAEEWLSVRYMSSEYNHDQHIFTLRYTQIDGGIAIQSRLIPKDSTEATPVKIASLGTVLLSSEPLLEIVENCIILQPNHVVVSSF
ncbi:malto-oligosyltrehalose trehalohydrolase [Gimesia aquarii]|uniref:Malto-oligosyltrehalose trehalohydrolase n=1 Tax=Gimesia aquarii TaxID=2527964 RepID=A0A517X0G1_9PLAN|nr:malto-oligosyltrehalose trehalohydrolase [Gimesia aquarii]QDU10997.1 Malto-oligosyltrehalose trehalohydrolase [Gimesia aquarii]